MEAKPTIRSYIYNSNNSLVHLSSSKSGPCPSINRLLLMNQLQFHRLLCFPWADPSRSTWLLPWADPSRSTSLLPSVDPSRSTSLLPSVDAGRSTWLRRCPWRRSRAIMPHCQYYHRRRRWVHCRERSCSPCRPLLPGAGLKERTNGFLPSRLSFRNRYPKY